MRNTTGKRPKRLQILLIGLFLYGSLSYSLSLAEYTLFQLRGEALFSPSLTFTNVNTPELDRLDTDCGTQLLPAAGRAPAALGEPVVLRCGRFWPFYRYSIQAPQTRASLDLGDDNNGAIRTVNQVTLALTLLLVALIGVILGLGLARRDARHTLHWSLVAFAASLALAGAYTGVMFMTDPHFGLGW
ncbi:hypothetical protein [Marinobacter sp. NFXS9]|uniref:hypothetical protein n=1 Tax=Marinobacter sp. NFXS9 TaxID=2818433 RepID=UPI0032DE2D31